MSQTQITLGYFPDARNYYHVYKISHSSVAEKPHSHNYFQICYIAKGVLVHGNKNQSVTLTQGDALIVPPELAHSIVVEEPGTEFYSLSFQENVFDPHFCYTLASKFLQAIKMENLEKKGVDLKLKVLLDENQQYLIASLFDCLICQSRTEERREESIACNLIAAILTTMAQAYVTLPSGKKRVEHVSVCHNIISECLDYIDDHYHEPLSIPFLSKKFAISVSSFSVWFPEVAGLSFKQYLNSKRIEHAAALIGVKSLNLNEIASIVGYDNHSTFYRNFMKYKKESPSDYRDRLINQDTN